CPRMLMTASGSRLAPRSAKAHAVLRTVYRVRGRPSVEGLLLHVSPLRESPRRIRLRFDERQGGATIGEPAIGFAVAVLVEGDGLERAGAGGFPFMHEAVAGRVLLDTDQHAPPVGAGVRHVVVFPAIDLA